MGTKPKATPAEKAARRAAHFRKQARIVELNAEFILNAADEYRYLMACADQATREAQELTATTAVV